MQDIEFTIEKGRLFILQCRSGKRTGVAAVKIAVDMVEEGLITKEEALTRVPPEALEQLLHPRIKNTGGAKPIAKGLNAGPGGASGHGRARLQDRHQDGRRGRQGHPRPQGNQPGRPRRNARIQGRSDPARRTHQPRGAGRSPVWHPDGLRLRRAARSTTRSSEFTANGVTVKEGDVITIDGTLGLVYNVELETEPATVTGDFGTFMAWADEVRKLGVRANADTPEHAAQAVELGAEGIGLCRTEHMFLGSRPRSAGSRHDPCRGRRNPRRGARQAASDAARGLRGHLQGDGRQAGYGPTDRPAAA